MIMIPSHEPLSDAFCLIKLWLSAHQESNAVLVCHKSDMSTFDLSPTQAEDDFMRNVIVILVTEDMFAQTTFASDLLVSVERKITNAGIIVYLPSAADISSGTISLLLVLCLLIALSKRIHGQFQLVYRKGLSLGHVFRYISHLPS
jgi:hypothetical protein